MNKKETFDNILRQISAFQRVPQSERKHVIRRALRHPLFWGTFLALILFWLGAFVSVFAATGIDYTFSLAPKYNFLDILFKLLLFVVIPLIWISFISLRIRNSLIKRIIDREYPSERSESNEEDMTEPKDLKLYYNISEVAKMFDVKETLLRYWETVFPQISPKKSGRNIRQYTKEDIEKIRIVHNLVKVRGLRLAAAAQLLRKNKEGVVQTADVLDELRAIRKELVRLKADISGLE